jgi:hypothetical protein
MHQQAESVTVVKPEIVLAALSVLRNRADMA